MEIQWLFAHQNKGVVDGVMDGAAEASPRVWPFPRLTWGSLATVFECFKWEASKESGADLTWVCLWSTAFFPWSLEGHFLLPHTCAFLQGDPCVMSCSVLMGVEMLICFLTIPSIYV